VTGEQESVSLEELSAKLDDVLGLHEVSAE